MIINISNGRCCLLIVYLRHEFLENSYEGELVVCKLIVGEKPCMVQLQFTINKHDNVLINNRLYNIENNVRVIVMYEIELLKDFFLPILLWCSCNFITL